ncbi:MAG TPA: acyl-CoA dehydrogenase family protein [Micromonosporaceae bacterium]|nr:acyl-CoA dehydrogenase family protein [Micromonosporaceae bacterium]
MTAPYDTGSADLRYSDIEQDLRGTVRELLTDRCQPADVLARCETAQPYDMGLWKTLVAELGVTALQVPEASGGQGATVRETAVVLEELGRYVAPVPYLGHSVLATTALLTCGSDLLSTVASGERITTLAVSLAAYPGGGFPDTVRAGADGLTGRVAAVPHATVADLLLVPAVGPNGPELHAVPAEAVTITPEVSLDLTRVLATVELAGAPAEPVGFGRTAVAALDSALLTGAGLLASEQVGIAEWCLETTVGYLKQRHQFGRQVGSFQALKHRLADLWQQFVTARAAARYAADALAIGSPDVPVAVAVAQSHCATVAVRAAEETVQLHGGIGMTWEHPAHLYLKRAKSSEIALGTPGRHRDRLATMIDLPGPVR